MVANDSFERTLPKSVQSGLDRFSDQMQEALGEHLISIVLYGQLIEDELEFEGADVNVMVVLKEISVSLLDEAALPVQVGYREFGLSVLLLTEDELQCSTDVFPIKFLDMQRNHRILCGKDVLSDLKISRDHLRLRCEQEIKNLMLRLHRSYLEQNEFPERIENTLIRSSLAFVQSLSVLVELKTGNRPLTIDAIVSGAAGIGLNIESLQAGLALYRGASQPIPDEIKNLYNSLMQAVHQAAVIVDLM